MKKIQFFMNNSKNTLIEIDPYACDSGQSVNTLKGSAESVDHEIKEMKKHLIDFSDIPERKNGSKVRLARQEFLDTLPPDIVQEMARRRLKELQSAGYKIQEKTT